MRGVQIRNPQEHRQRESRPITNAALATFVYKPANNHDPDGESNGTTISVAKPSRNSFRNQLRGTEAAAR